MMMRLERREKIHNRGRGDCDGWNVALYCCGMVHVHNVLYLVFNDFIKKIYILFSDYYF